MPTAAIASKLPSQPELSNHSNASMIVILVAFHSQSPTGWGEFSPGERGGIVKNYPGLFANVGSDMLEVERKFSVPPYFTETLLRCGARKISQVEFEDKYFDLPENQLTCQGCWLRKRDNKWQLKIRAEERTYVDSFDNYRELENQEEIIQELTRRLGGRDAAAHRVPNTVEEFLAVNGCEEFACFSTYRSRFSLHGGVFVDIDEASFGYGLGELEMVVDKQADILLAKKAIAEVAGRLGNAHMSSAFPRGGSPGLPTPS